MNAENPWFAGKEGDGTRTRGRRDHKEAQTTRTRRGTTPTQGFTETPGQAHQPEITRDARDEFGRAEAPAALSVASYPLFWRVRRVRPEWFGRRCRIVIHGKRGNRLIEFDNGDRVVCPGAYLRRHHA